MPKTKIKPAEGIRTEIEVYEDEEMKKQSNLNKEFKLPGTLAGALRLINELRNELAKTKKTMEQSRNELKKVVRFMKNP